MSGPVNVVTALPEGVADFKDQGFTVLLVNMREDRETVKRAVTTRRYTGRSG